MVSISFNCNGQVTEHLLALFLVLQDLSLVCK